MLRVIVAMAAIAVSTPSLAQDYVLGAGDVVNIQVFDEPQLSGETLVPSACRVEVELIGSVSICGRTTREIAADVQKRLAEGYLVAPHVIVEVTTYGSQKIEIRGAIKTPGIQILTGPTSLSQVITTAGGPQGDNVVEVDLLKADGSTHTYALSKLNTADQPVFVDGGDVVNLRQGRHVYVDGEVKTEGPVPFHEGLTVSQAVSLAGGPGEYASNRRVYILKESGERIPVNLRRVRDGRDADVLLEPDDRITVRPSYI